MLLTSSHLNTEVNQTWTRMLLGWETAWELLAKLAWVWISKILCAELANPKPAPPPMVVEYLMVFVSGWYNQYQWRQKLKASCSLILFI